MNRQDISRVADRIVAKRAFVTFIAILLAALHAALAITAAIEKSPTFDEPTHLTAGYSYWLKNDYRLDPENGNWPARWAAATTRSYRADFSGKCCVGNRLMLGKSVKDFFITAAIILIGSCSSDAA